MKKKVITEQSKKKQNIMGRKFRKTEEEFNEVINSLLRKGDISEQDTTISQPCKCCVMKSACFPSKRHLCMAHNRADRRSIFYSKYRSDYEL